MEILCTTDREKGREPQEKAVSFYFVLQNGQGQKNRIDLQRPHKVLSAFLAPECGIITSGKSELLQNDQKNLKKIKKW